MKTQHGIRKFAALATLTGALVATATLADNVRASDDSGLATLGQMTVVARREAPIAHLGSLVVSAPRLPASYADLGAITVSAPRFADTQLAHAWN
jgi:hypothetical protein